MVRADFSWNIETYRGYCSSELKLEAYNATWEHIGGRNLCGGSCVGYAEGFAKMPFTQLRFYSEAISKERFTRWCGWRFCSKYECSGNYKATDHTVERITDDKYCKTISLSPINSYASWVNTSFTIHWEVQYWLNMRYKIIPLHTLVPETFFHNIKNTYLPIGAKAKLFAKKGFSSELYHYQVATEKDPSRYPNEYNWQNLPVRLKENGGEVLSVSAEDVFGSEAEAHKNIGKTVYFQFIK